MVILFILGIVLFIIGSVVLAENSNRETLLVGTITIGTILITMTIDAKIDSERPSALDVYRNRTELRITSVNGVPQDTVVVYKNQ